MAYSFVATNLQTKHFECIPPIVRAGEPSASDEDVYKAAKQANIHGFVEQLPNKYLTVLSASSTQLSGGQRQR